MTSNKKMTIKHGSDEEAFLEHARYLLNDIWEHWQKGYGHSPATAHKKLTAKIKQFHKEEVKAAQAVKKVKKSVRRKGTKKSSVKKRSSK